MASSEVTAALSEHPEDELVRVQLDEAKRKKRQGPTVRNDPGATPAHEAV